MRHWLPIRVLTRSLAGALLFFASVLCGCTPRGQSSNTERPTKATRSESGGLASDAQARMRPTSEREKQRDLCGAGDARACAEYGAMSQVGMDGPEDFHAAAWAYEMGCQRGNGAACRGLATLLLYGAGVARDEPRARRVMLSGCKYGDKEACRIAKSMGEMD